MLGASNSTRSEAGMKDGNGKAWDGVWHITSQSHTALIHPPPTSCLPPYFILQSILACTFNQITLDSYGQRAIPPGGHQAHRQQHLTFGLTPPNPQTTPYYPPYPAPVEDDNDDIGVPESEVPKRHFRNFFHRNPCSGWRTDWVLDANIEAHPHIADYTYKVPPDIKGFEPDRLYVNKFKYSRIASLGTDTVDRPTHPVPAHPGEAGAGSSSSQFVNSVPPSGPRFSRPQQHHPIATSSTHYGLLNRL
ncbi:hypothetical protein HK097_008902 [Rhizophlyctis rosea]|uniref:Uncharacterized protein n=1 Tax=Rhizophlyctis rosea TaxID=64517 RepID=A0AAD5X495_9FUNG|nr:hypothetical protein HK097_008902 [Rhizophlyctis rosea]